MGGIAIAVSELLWALWLAAVLAVVLSGFFVWIGAKIARVEKSSFWRVVLTGIGAAWICWMVPLNNFLVPLRDTGLALIIGIILSFFVIKGALETSIRKALLVWTFHLIAQVLAIVITLFASAR